MTRHRPSWPSRPASLWTLGAAIGPLVANVAIQVLVTALIGVVLARRDAEFLLTQSRMTTSFEILDNTGSID